MPAFALGLFFLTGSVASGAGVALLSEASPLGEDGTMVAAAGPPDGVETADEDAVDFVFESFAAVESGR